MDTKALRQKILDLAIRGKLVPQDPNDEPASVLLERIREQKKQMVKDGKLKPKDIKKDTVIFKGDDNLHYERFNDGTVKCIEDEIPFELPEGWEWERLGYLAQYKKGPFGSSITKAMFVPDIPDAIKVYEQKNAINKDATLGSYFISAEKYESLKGFEVFPNDIIVSCAGTIGETFVLPIGMRKGIINQALMKISLFDLETMDFYLTYFDFKLKSAVQEQGHGIALKNIPPFDVLKKYLIPIPPIQEQYRIVTAVNNLISKVDFINTDSDAIVNLVSQIKSKILDLAIRGKLVPQDPNDEPASMLLERIRAEKEELIKQGKIKRNKKESVIFKGDDNSYYESIGDETTNIDDEIPFELPQNWEWSRLQTICYPITDGTHKTPTYSDTGYIFLSAKNITTGKINWNDVMYIPKSLHDELYSRISPQINDILLAKNGTTGVAAIVDRECEFDIYVTLALLRVISNNDILPQYLLKIIASNTIQDYFNSSLKGIGVPNLHLEHIRTTLIPIPPINEQKRISKKVDQLFFLLDSIAKNAN